MARRRFQRSGTSPARRKLIWARTAGAINIVASDSIDLLAAFQVAKDADIVGVTPRRLLIDLQVEVETEATNGINELHYGVIVADQDFEATLAAAGISSAAALHRDWMLWGASGPPGGGSATVVGTEWHIHLDIKTGRKMDEVNQGLFLVLENAVGGVYDVGFAVQVLLALP